MLKKGIFFFLYLFLVLQGSSQTGKLSIETFYGEWNSLHPKIYLINDQNVTVRIKEYEETSYIKFDSLIGGTYSLEVRISDSLFLRNSYIIVKEGSTTFLSLADLKGRIKKNTNDSTEGHFHMEVGYHFTYSPKELNEISNKFLNETYSIGGSVSPIEAASKNIGFGLIIGTSINYTGFKSDTTLILPGPHQRERYFGWGAYVGPIIRITGYNMKKKDKHGHSRNGFKWDIGVVYNLPIMFRHTTFDGTRKVENFGIHKFNEVYAITRIGYKYFVLQGEYNLTEFLIGRYPEVYPARVGIAILFQGH